MSHKGCGRSITGWLRSIIGMEHMETILDGYCATTTVPHVFQSHRTRIHASKSPPSADP